jgi:small subunit ribosomal protein S9
MELTNTSGRRKTAVARVYLKKGSGNITVNDRDYKEYFATGILHYIVTQAFEVTNNQNQYDVKVNVAGGGFKGQAEAVRLGISKALCEISADYRTMLKPAGLLTRDPRMVERKKPGQKKARKRFQFSKR